MIVPASDVRPTVADWLVVSGYPLLEPGGERAGIVHRQQHHPVPQFCIGRRVVRRRVVQQDRFAPDLRQGSHAQERDVRLDPGEDGGLGIPGKQRAAVRAEEMVPVARHLRDLRDDLAADPRVSLVQQIDTAPLIERWRLTYGIDIRSELHGLPIPADSEIVIEGEIVKWLVAPGRSFAANDAIVEVMTDKTTVEIPAPRLVEGAWQERPENARRITLWEHFDRDAILQDFYTRLDHHTRGAAE